MNPAVTQTEPNQQDHVVPLGAASISRGSSSSNPFVICTAVVRGAVVAPTSLVGRWSSCEQSRSRLRLRQLLASEASQPPLRSWSRRRSVSPLRSSRCGRSPWAVAACGRSRLRSRREYVDDQ